MQTKTFLSIFDPVLLKPAIKASFRKLSPSVQRRNPVMFVVYIGSILTTVLAVQAFQGVGDAPFGFIVAIATWLWFTVLFANVAEALAEGRSKAQAESLRSLKKAPGQKNLYPLQKIFFTEELGYLKRRSTCVKGMCASLMQAT